VRLAVAILAHWPHFLPVALALATFAYQWRADRRHRGLAREPRAQIAPIAPAAHAPARAPVRRETARRGAIVLGPLLGALATGAVVYGIDLSNRRPSASLIWTHAGLSTLLCLLVVYKLAGSDLAHARRNRRAPGFTAVAGSLLLAALLAPILVSGIVVLLAPSSTSFAANLHLTASAWWTLLAIWHLHRYTARSIRTLRAGRPKRAGAGLRLSRQPPPGS
jgi:hypothetical protein